MNLDAIIDDHSISLTARQGYMDAAATESGNLAALELEVEGALRVHQRDDGRESVLSLSFADAAHMGSLGALLLAKGYTMLVDEIKSALEGDSNDAEHDALEAVADALGIEWTSYDDREDV